MFTIFLSPISKFYNNFIIIIINKSLHVFIKKAFLIFFGSLFSCKKLGSRMKISALNNISNKTLENENKKINSENKPVTSISITSLTKDSLSEAIGRSQVVAFKGINRSDTINFKHTCSDDNRDEEINYNKTTGVFTHIVKDLDGKVVLSEVFNPQEHTQNVVKTDKNGNTTRIITTIDGEKRITDDAKGRRLYYREDNFANQTTHEEITEYDNGRAIINDTGSDNVLRTQVFDLKRKAYVLSGPLVIATKTDPYKNIRTTYNLITKDVLKKEKLDKNGGCIEYHEYSEKTGYLTNEGYLLKNGDWEEIEYRNAYPNTMETRTIFAKNRKSQMLYEYNVDGKTEKRKTGEIYRTASDSFPISVINYMTNVPRDIILSRIDYDSEDKSKKSYTISDYNPNPNNNVKVKAQMVFDGVVIEDIKYAPDGNHFEYTIEYFQNGSRVETEYTGRNRKVKERKFSPSNFLLKEVYYTNKIIFDRVARTIERDPQTGVSRDIFFYDSGKKQYVKVCDENGDIAYEENFRPNGTIERTKQYYTDGTAEEKIYDENGDYVQTRHYNKNGDRDDYFHRRGNTNSSQRSSGSTNKDSYSGKTNSNYGGSNQNYYSYDYGTQYTQRTKEKSSTVETDEQLLKKVADYCAGQKFSSISENDWIGLGRILDVEPDRLKNMTRQDYRKFALKFHPDVNSSPEATEIFCILNALYGKNNS